MPIGGAIAAVGSVAGGALAANAQAKGAKKAANAVTAAADEATALQREIYYDQRNLLAPSITAGARAQAQRMLMMGYSPDEVKRYLASTSSAVAGSGAEPASGPGAQNGAPFSGSGLFGYEGEPVETYAAPTTTDLAPEDYSWVDDWSYEASSPSYGFRFDEGQRALERSQAAGGDFFSGDTAMALSRYGQDYASTEWENDWRRLGDLAGEGADATGTTIQVAGNFGNNAAANTVAAGNARATGYQQAGNAWGSFWQGAAGIPMYAYGQGWLGKGKGK